MAAVGGKARAGGRRLAEIVAPTVMSSVSEVPELRRRVENQHRRIEHLERRIGELEGEIQESRRLQQRVAELTDIVAEVLIPASDRDDERVKRALDEFARTSF